MLIILQFESCSVQVQVHGVILHPTGRGNDKDYYIVWGLTCTLGSQKSRCRNLQRFLGWSVIRQISPSSLSPCSAVKQTSARNASLLTAVARIPPRYRCAADLKISNSTRITPPNFTVSPCHLERVGTCGLLSFTYVFFFFSGFRDPNLLWLISDGRAELRLQI